MSSLETTEMKLRTTPTGGVSGEHSPYYRRLLSAGYKGFLQGSIGGAGFYGLLGLAVGTAVAIPAMIFTGGAAALWLIPAAAGVGLAKGATTFGNIGTVAAINAESADLAEQRRYLLDRYYELPDGPEGDKQAEIIKQELANIHHTEEPKPLFHWKTVAICAAIGVALSLTLISPLGATLGLAAPVEHALIAAGLAHEGVAVTGAIAAIGAALGAAMGAVVGIDRHYVRHWFDGTEKILHDESHSLEAIHARQQQVERLRQAEVIDNETKHIMERRGSLHYDHSPAEATETAPTPTSRALIHSLDAPATKIQAPAYAERVADLTQAIHAPAL